MSVSFQIFSVGEGNNKFRTPAFAGLYPSAAAMAFCDLPNDGKPRAGPLDLSPYGSLKQLEYALFMLRRNPRATIAHCDTDRIPARRLRPIGDDFHVRCFTFAGKLESIGDEVIDRLGRPSFVHSQSMEVLRHVNPSTGGVDLTFETLEGFGHDTFAINFFTGNPDPLGARERQDVIEETVQSLRS